MDSQYRYREVDYHRQPSYSPRKLSYDHRQDRNHQNNTMAPPPYESNLSNYSIPPPPMAVALPQPSSGQKLIAIPATGHKTGSPIMRAWPPALESSGLSKVEFLDFIDRLNRVTVSSPPVQLLGLAGNIVGMVPLATAQIVGGAVNATAMVAGAALRMGHTEILLKEANRDIFGPLGLNVKLAKMEAVAKLTGMPIFEESGKLDKNSRFLPPLNEGIDSRPLGVHQRRLMALQPYIAPLSTEALPQIEESTNYIARMHEYASTKQAAKEENAMMKKRSKQRQDKDKGKRKDERKNKAKDKVKDEEEKALRKLIFLIVETRFGSRQE